MFRFGFDGLCGFLNELKPMFKITHRFAQNNYLVWTGKNQAYEGLGSVASNMMGFGSIQWRRGWSIKDSSIMSSCFGGYDSFYTSDAMQGYVIITLFSRCGKANCIYRPVMCCQLFEDIYLFSRCSFMISLLKHKI